MTVQRAIELDHEEEDSGGGGGGPMNVAVIMRVWILVKAFFVFGSTEISKNDRFVWNLSISLAIFN